MSQYFPLGLLGYRIGYSLSPEIHHYWMNLYGVRGEYRLYDTDPENKVSGFEALFAQKLHGFNITVPYKEFAFKKLGPSNARLTAINTIYRTAQGHYVGVNTDVLGGLDVFRHTNLTGSIVILGNGGTSRALVEIFYLLGASQVRIVERRKKQWHHDYQEMLSFHGWDKILDLVDGADLLINTVPRLDFKPANLKRKTLVCDYTYGRPLTPFRRYACLSGGEFIRGEELLLKQAQYSFNHWFDIFPDITDDLRKKLNGFIV